MGDPHDRHPLRVARMRPGRCELRQPQPAQRGHVDPNTPTARPAPSPTEPPPASRQRPVRAGSTTTAARTARTGPRPTRRAVRDQVRRIRHARSAGRALFVRKEVPDSPTDQPHRDGHREDAQHHDWNRTDNRTGRPRPSVYIDRRREPPTCPVAFGYVFSVNAVITYCWSDKLRPNGPVLNDGEGVFSTPSFKFHKAIV